MSPHSSTSSSLSEGSAFPWILEHLLAYPGTYEIPLRTMYALNSTPHAQQYSRQSVRQGTPSLSSGSSPESSPASSNFPVDQQPQPGAQSTTEHFKSCLLTHISQLPSQPFSLPPAFITSFVRRCFTADLCEVDFTQALTALDYLKDLETRRKREFASVLQRLDLDKLVLDRDGDELKKKNPALAEWVTGMQDRERKVEALYTQVYLGLRRWTLINEMRLEPFSKANSIAMLNTLYPPATIAPPTRQLTSTILSSQRSAFFRYIQAVEKNGKGILKNLEIQGKRTEDTNGWAIVRETVDKYLRTANGVIEECLEVTDADFFSSSASGEGSHRTQRRADSGVSFVVGDRPSTGSSTSSIHKQSKSASYINKPLPASPKPPQPSRSTTAPPTPKKRGTTLEKIARGLGNFRSRHDIKEIGGNVENQERNRSLRKMKSASSIGGLRAKHARTASDEQNLFEIDDAKRQRLILEARREKENQHPQGLGMSYES